jgi:RNAse (barnase) inhibitor barstar
MVEKKIITRVNGSKNSYRWSKKTSAEQLVLDHAEAMTPPATPTHNYQKIHLLGESDTLPPLLSSIGDALEFDNLEMYLRRLMGSAREKEVDAETIELAEFLLESLKTEEAWVGFEGEKEQEIRVVKVLESAKDCFEEKPETSRAEEQALEKVIMDADTKFKQLQDIIQQLEATLHAGVQFINNLETQVRSKKRDSTISRPPFQDIYDTHLEYYDDPIREEALFRQQRRVEQTSIRSQLEEQIKFQRKVASNLQALFDQCAEVLEV